MGYICKSIKYRIIKVNISTCSPNPNNVGQPSLLAIEPTKLDNNEFTNLYVHGLNKINNTNVV